MNSDGNDTADTSPTFKVLEEGASTLGKEEAGQLAQRQMKFIQHLHLLRYIVAIGLNSRIGIFIRSENDDNLVHYVVITRNMARL